MPLNLIIRIKLMMNKKNKLNNYQKKINFCKRNYQKDNNKMQVMIF